jgi:hypothetical protein
MKLALGNDYATVETTINTTLKWLEDNNHLTTEEYEIKLKQVETLLMPLIQKAYQSNMPTNKEDEDID